MTNQTIFNVLVLFLGFAVYMVMAFLSRRVHSNVFKELDSNLKNSIYKSFEPFRKYNLIPAIFILVIYFILMKLYPEYRLYFNIGFGLLYVFYIISTLIYIYHILSKIKVPIVTIRRILLGFLFQYLGMIFVILGLIFWFLLKTNKL